MREWLSWWSTTLPRSGSRVRVPSRALLNEAETLMNTAFPFFFVPANLKTVYEACDVEADSGSKARGYISQKVIMQGEIIKQYEDDKPFPSCLLLGMSINGKYLHVVVASDNINLHIIMAYYPSIDEWEPDFKTRKGR